MWVPRVGAGTPCLGTALSSRLIPVSTWPMDGLETPRVAAQEAETDPRHSC